MRMTKQEVRDEGKQQEGDPHIKSKIRALRVQRARRRMMAAVPEADVVVTNPTHYAVALKYDQDRMAAPRVVAKGADQVALRIREVAREHSVPLIENPPLARALFAGVELDQEIPEEHYRAVAQIISYVMKLKSRLPATAGPR
jgi:flagellar biosynthesis protein FlhB